MSQRELQHDDGDTSLAPERPRVDPPPLFSVVLLNDDFTPMEFVVDLLTGLYAMAQQAALDITLAVHERGQAVIGSFTRDLAETRIAQTHQKARAAGHPLRCQITQA